MPEITEALRQHPEGYGNLHLRYLECPDDLWAAPNERVNLADVPFLAAAYGLSIDALELPAADTPDMVEAAEPLPVQPFIPYEDR